MKKVETKKLQAIKKFISNKQVACTARAFFGDEAKRKMIDKLSTYFYKNYPTKQLLEVTSKNSLDKILNNFL